VTVQTEIRRLPTDALTASELRAIRALMDAAFDTADDGPLTDEDWQHSLGGMHFLLVEGGVLAGHAAVVERELHLAGRPLRTGYVEAVATAAHRHGQGLGSALMLDVNEYIREHFELGALGTERISFYERLGWRAWQGPSFVRAQGGLVATPDEDGYILVLDTPSTPPVDPRAPISCQWRPGDGW
jgi:aminoglycoside 2'-N-acetyltransferase I